MARDRYDLAEEDDDRDDEFDDDDEDEDDAEDRRRELRWRRRRREEDARRKLVGPGVGLIVAGFLGIMGGSVLIVLALNIPMPPPPPPQPGQDPAAFNAGFKLGFYGVYVCPAALGILMSGGMILGGNGMRSGGGRGGAVLACVLGLMPCHVGWLVSLPCAIWGFVVLNDEEVLRLHGRS